MSEFFGQVLARREGEDLFVFHALECGDIDEKNGIIRVSKSFNKRINTNKCPKNGSWRNVDINSLLKEIIQELHRLLELAID